MAQAGVDTVEHDIGSLCIDLQTGETGVLNTSLENVLDLIDKIDPYCIDNIDTLHRLAFFKFRAAETDLIFVGVTLNVNAELKRQGRLEDRYMIIKIKRKVVAPDYAKTIAVDIKREGEGLHHIVANEELHRHVLYLVVGLVAETKPFAKSAVCVGIDKRQGVAAELYGSIKRRKYHIHRAVDIDSRSDIGAYNTAEVAYHRHDRVYRRHKFEETLDLETVELKAETELHVIGLRSRIKSRQRDIAGIGGRRQLMQVYAAAIRQYLSVKVLEQKVGVYDIAGVERNCSIDVCGYQQWSDTVGVFAHEGIELLFEDIVIG